MNNFLKATNRESIAQLATTYSHLLKSDEGAEYDELIEIDLNELEPHVNGPFTPDLATPLSFFKQRVKNERWPETLSASLIGSCTNSSYEDLSRSASIAQQALEKGLTSKVPFLVTPGSEQIRATVQRDGQLDLFQQVGATTLANACGPCIGQWDRKVVHKHERNSIMTSYNRNFAGRNDGNPNTHNFVVSPEVSLNNYKIWGEL